MKAVLLREHGGPAGLDYASAPDPEPGSGEVLVRVRACALNHLDLWVRRGLPAYKVRLPHILGSDIAGEVAEAGPGASAKPGAKVLVAPGRSCFSCEACLSGGDNRCLSYGIIGANGGPGGNAELISVPERCLVPYPEGLSFEEAAALPLTYLTAWNMLMRQARLEAGQSVLVLGAGSGVGTAAVQIAKLAGARVLAASRSDKTAQASLELGADEAIVSPPGDLHKAALKFSGGRGVDVVFEHVGPAVFMKALKSLRRGGTLVSCGSTTGPVVELDMRYVFSRELSIRGVEMGPLSDLFKLARLAQAGRLKPRLDSIYPLAETARAHERLEAGGHFGKIVLRVD